MGRAADLQALVTAPSFKYMAQGRLSHRHIPDNPLVESERRQMFFGAALGIPTFFVHRNSRNLLLRRILKRTAEVRISRRYPGYLRVPVDQYRKALLKTLLEDGADLVEALNVGETLRDLRLRLEAPEHYGAAARLTHGILDKLGKRNPMAVSAPEFNGAAEAYYRDDLRCAHLREGLEVLAEDFRHLDREQAGDRRLREALDLLLQGRSAAGFLEMIRNDLLAERLPAATLGPLIGVVLLSVYRDSRRADQQLQEGRGGDEPAASVC
jgi:hypothetical protein